MNAAAAKPQVPHEGTTTVAGAGVGDVLHIPGVGDVFCVDMGGINAAVVLPTIPEAACPELREGLTRRRLVMVTGECPCGARRPHLSRAVRRRLKRGRNPQPPALEVVHEDDCPARDDRVRQLLRWTS